jgi:hypothetical protein
VGKGEGQEVEVVWAGRGGSCCHAVCTCDPPPPPRPISSEPKPSTHPHALPHAGVYLCFAAVGAVAVASIYATVPETKGKTLEEIEALWAPAGGSGE